MKRFYHRTRFLLLKKMNVLVITLAIVQTVSMAQCFSCKNAPAGTIFCDDFETDDLNSKYFEINNNAGDFVRKSGVGRDGTYGMRIRWQKAEVGAGVLSKSFGRTPDTYIGKNASQPNQDFDEIFWRMDVKAQEGWVGGGPAKLSRALCLANSNWAEGMMAHLWSGGKDNLFLGMDPASGIGTDGILKSTKYNDFANLRWLGFKSGNIDMFSTANSGRWFCVVGHVKLNTPGINNGIFEFWINDTLQASSQNLNWHSTWNTDPKNMHINAIFFENYWNDGSPVEQERYFDNLVIGTKPISCQCTTTGSEDQTAKEAVEVLWSPYEKKVMLLNKSIGLVQKYALIGLDGQVWMKDEWVDEVRELNLSTYKAGMYFLKIEDSRVYKFILTD